MINKKNILKPRELSKGLISINSNFDINNKDDLSNIYTPGVSVVCKEIEKEPKKAKKLTSVGNSIAVITNGTAVLGLGNIGTLAGFPIVEAKSLVYKNLAGVNAIPISIKQTSNDELITTIKNISESFSGIHLEDIKAPECFYIEEILKSQLDIPVYHDDQHGTAIAVLSALYNASKIVDKKFEDLKIVLLGAGASGIATARLLKKASLNNIILVDRNGSLVDGDITLNTPQKNIAKITNPNKIEGSLKNVIKDSDVFIGLSEGNVLTAEMVKTMNINPIIFALANPVPEIDPETAKEAGAAIVATGSSSYPNQINNILVFPGLFKGLLEANISNITDDIMIQIAKDLASLIKEPNANKIIPGVFEKGIIETVCKSIKNTINNCSI